MAGRWQDWAKGAADAAAYGVGRAARAVHDAATSPEGQRVAAEAKKAGLAAANAVGTAAKKAAPVVRDAARKAVPVIKQAAEKAAPVVEDVAGRAGRAARSAADRIREGYRSSAAERELRGATNQVRSAGANATVRDVSTAEPVRPGHPLRADGRPQVSVDDATGQPVQTEVYVINEDGSRDYDVFPHDNPTRRMGPLARRVAGLVLVLAGIPMLILPGPGLIAITAGLALMAGKDPSQPGDPDKTSL